MMRAKMKIDSITHYDNTEQVDLNMSAVCKNKYEGEGLDENNTFAKFTPNANLTISICNPALMDKFSEGQTFYVDFTETEKG